MATRKRKYWSRTIEADGVRVRVYKRSRTGNIYLETRAGGRKRRESLGHTDKEIAKKEAKAAAARIAELRRAGTVGRLTLGQLRRLYLRYKGPQLSEDRKAYVERTLDLFAKHLEADGEPFPIEDFDQTRAKGYEIARSTGAIHSDDPRASRDGVADGTIRNELQLLSTVCRWACGFKQNGRYLLSGNPLDRIKLPKVTTRDRARPVASRERYEALMAVADKVEPRGQLRLWLAFAWHTGRRISAILHLRASDLLLARDQLWRTLAECGDPDADGKADAWGTGLHWRPEHDKKGVRWFTPLPDTLRAELDRYLARHPAVGEAWLFPYWKRPKEPTPKNTADYYLKKAEREAGLPHLRRGGWHAFRRAWASRRKHLPLKDIMEAGGWSDPSALQSAYQHADPDTVRRVMDLEETG